MLPAKQEKRKKIDGGSSGGRPRARFRTLYRGAVLRDIAGRIRRRGHPRREARRQRGSLRRAGRRGRRGRAVPADQPQQEVHHARSDEAGRAGGDAPAGRDRRRGRRQSAAADAARDEARLRIAEGDQARHHPDDGDRVRRAGAVVRPRRLRRRRPSDVGRGLHDRQGRSAVPGRGELGRFRHRAALRVRHAGGADRARQIRARADRRGRAAGDRAHPSPTRR